MIKIYSKILVDNIRQIRHPQTNINVKLTDNGCYSVCRRRAGFLGGSLKRIHHG